MIYKLVPATRPFPWAAILNFFRQRELPGVEVVSDVSYCRAEVLVAYDEASGTLKVDGPGDPVTRNRLTRMFDLEADRLKIENHLQLSPAFLPGAWCPFELGVRAILGQQISVAAARTLAGRLRARMEIEPNYVANQSLDGLGILPSRVKTLRAFAEAAQCGSFAYSYGSLCAIPGIGPWTAEYIGMRARRDPDAFPSGDLILRRAAKPGTLLSERALLNYAERWRPFRAYAAIALWASATTFPSNAAVPKIPKPRRFPLSV